MSMTEDRTSEYAQVLFTFESEQEWRHMAVQVTVDRYAAPDHILPDLEVTRDLQTATETHHGPAAAAANYVFLAKYRLLLNHLHPKMAYRDEVPTYYFDMEEYWSTLKWPGWLMDYRIASAGTSRLRDDWFIEVRIPDPENNPLPERRGKWQVGVAPIDDGLFDPYTRDDWEFDGSLEEAIDYYV